MKKLGSILLYAFLILFILFVAMVWLGEGIGFVIGAIKIAGCGSVIRGIFTAPFLIFGIIQILRGIIAIIDKDSKKMESEHKNAYPLFLLYLISTIFGVISIINSIGYWK